MNTSSGALPANSALIIVDVQQGFNDPAWGPRNNPHAETNIARLLAAWRESGRPVFHIQHDSALPESPLRPGQPGHDLKPEVQPQGEEPVIHKTVNSAFIGTDLEARLRDAGIETVIITGLTTNHCVSTTARMAGNLGFTTYVVSDATATFSRIGPGGRYFPSRDVHELSLASLHDEFAIVWDTEQVLGNLA